GARQGEGRLLGTELDVTQPVFQAAHQRRFGASAKVAFDALADGLDLRDFQPGDLGNHLPDGSVIGAAAIVEKMLDSAYQLLDLGFVDAGSAARCTGVALMGKDGELAKGRHGLTAELAQAGAQGVKVTDGSFPQALL